MPETANAFVDHLERYFGRIERGWRVPYGQQFPTSPKINFVKCAHGLVADAVVTSTVGLSLHLLHSPRTGKQIRQELFLMAKEQQFDATMPSALGQVVEERLATGKAVLRGEAIWKPGGLFGSTNFVALFATLPVYYPRELWAFNDVERGKIMLCWLLPIKQREYEYLCHHGWSKFENLLDQAQFDLYDLKRSSLI
jgi:hypothetical protein